MDLRGKLVRRLQQLSIAFHDDSKTGVLQSKLLRDVESVQMLCMEFFMVMVQGMVGVLVVIVVTFVKGNYEVALFYLVSVPVCIFLYRFFFSKLQLRNHELRLKIESMSSRISDMILMIPITRAHGLEEQEIELVDVHLKEVKAKGEYLDRLNAFFIACSWVSFQIPRIICIILIAYMGLQHKMTIGAITLYNAYFVMITNSINMVFNSFPVYVRGVEALTSINEVLDSHNIEKNEGKISVQNVVGKIEFKDVSFSYPKATECAVNNFSLQVNPGETIAIVGESGSGKSTLMSLVIGFRRPLRGEILIDDIDMESLNLRDCRKFLAVVPQKTILFAGSIYENVSYGLSHASEDRVNAALDIANCSEFIAKLPDRLDTIIGENGAKLSGGQCQRIAIARAIIRNPKIIIFDEATSALDIISEKLVQDAIDKMIEGRTTFIVAHRLSTIRNADRIIVMKKGKIVELGTHDELMLKNKEFASLRNLQK
jgi:ATP-binding cassette subfamily B protein